MDLKGMLSVIWARQITCFLILRGGYIVEGGYQVFVRI